jgi:5'-3' exonuclease
MTAMIESLPCFQRPILLLDGTGILVRASKAAHRTRRLSAPDGQETGPLLFFINMVSLHLRKRLPFTVIACWDAVGASQKSWRREILPLYKKDHGDIRANGSHRLAMKFCLHSGIGLVQQPGFEADDGIAACIRAIRGCSDFRDRPVTIISDDGDLHQLLGPKITQAESNYRETTELSADCLNAVYGCRPEEWPLYRALCGDRSDGLPGVAGVGPARALKLCQRAGWDLERLCQLPEIRNPEYVRAAYAVSSLLDPPQQLDDAAWRRQFMRLYLGEWDRSGGTLSFPGDTTRLHRFLDELGMKSVVKRLGEGSLF